LTTLVAFVRGCGTRKKSGIYWEVKLGTGPRARPLEEFLLDPPQPVPPHLRISPRGVQPIEVGGVTHVIDWIGSENYPNVCDFLEECLLPDEHVATDNGLVPIEDIHEGDNVLTHRGTFRRVTATSRRHHQGDVISLTTAYYNQPLRLTPEHPVYRAKVLRGRKRKAVDGVSGERILDRDFVPARDIEVGDYLCYPIRRTQHDIDSVVMAYTRAYPRVYASSVRTDTLRSRALTLRSDTPLPIRVWQHRLLQRLSGQEYWTTSEIRSVAADVYRWDTGLFRGIATLVSRGLLRRLRHGVYRVTAEGVRCAGQPHRSFRDLARTLGVSTATAEKLVHPPHKTRRLSITVPVGVTLMRLIGYYLAEGSVANTLPTPKPHTYYLTEFSFGKGDKERGYADEVQQAAHALGFGASITLKDGCYHVTVRSRYLAHFLVENFGKGAHNKTIPAWALALPTTKLAPLIEAYLNGDGYLHGHERWAVTMSPQLAYAVAQAANRLGWRTSICRYPSRHENHRDQYRVGMYRNRGTSTFADDEYMYLQVTRVARLGYSGPVCNLQVDEDESYCTTYHVVHNCRHLGLSRRIPESFDFGKLTPESRILLVHARAWVGNSAAYGPFRCPTTTEGHPEETACCAGVWWRDVEGVVALEDGGDNPLAVRRSMPSFAYTAGRRPDGVTPDYRAAFFASFPATRLVVIEGGHERALARARRAHLDVDVVED